MNKNFRAIDWKSYLPIPICEDHPEYGEFYEKAWELARDHVKEIDGMPQNPYMDEAFCATQLWIWDTCFMSLFCKFAGEVFPGVESFQNFYSVLYEGKLLPKVIPPENEPDWTETTPGVPAHIMVHIADNPPLFAWSEYENALIHGDREYLRTLLYGKQSLQRHYEWFESQREKRKIHGVLAPNCLIHEPYGYKWEGARSGMDNTPRGRTEIPSPKRPNNPDMYWLDAICQQALSARMIARLFAIVGDCDNEKIWNGKFEEKKKIVNELYWDPEDRFYYDIDCNDHHFYKIKSVASFWPLIAKIASEEQARELVKHVSDPNTFGGILPFSSVARNDPEFSKGGKYWRGAMWLPTTYMALRGMSEYGFHKEAHEAAVSVLDYMWKTYQSYEPHSIWEAYAPEGYRPATCTDDVRIVRKDFCGWSALGPISVYLEYVLGFHSIDAFDRTVRWHRPADIKGKIGVKNLRFGDVVTDVTAEGKRICVTTNAPYTIEMDGKAFSVHAGENIIDL